MPPLRHQNRIYQGAGEGQDYARAVEGGEDLVCGTVKRRDFICGNHGLEGILSVENQGGEDFICLDDVGKWIEKILSGELRRDEVVKKTNMR